MTLQFACNNTKRYKLRGTICTNGLELHLLAYDTASPRRQTPAATSQGSDDGDDLAGEDDLYQGLQDIDEEFELDDVLREPESDEDLGISQTSIEFSKSWSKHASSQGAEKWIADGV